MSYGYYKRKRIFVVLMVFFVLILLTGIGLLLVEPIKTLKREQITNDAMDVMLSKMSQAAATAVSDGTVNPDNDIEVTFVVPKDGNEVPGEDIDVFDADESAEASIRAFISSRMAKLPDNVTLVCIGVLRIDSINKTLPVWNSTSSVALRYGVGLYEYSAKPGKPGNSTILGHNMRNTTLFSKLKNCKAGDSVKFCKLDGSVLEYRIYDIKIVYKNELGKYAAKSASDKQQLTLITCANDEYGQGYRRVLLCRPVS